MLVAVNTEKVIGHPEPTHTLAPKTFSPRQRLESDDEIGNSNQSWFANFWRLKKFSVIVEKVVEIGVWSEMLRGGTKERSEIFFESSVA